MGEWESWECAALFLWYMLKILELKVHPSIHPSSKFCLKCIYLKFIFSDVVPCFDTAHWLKSLETHVLERLKSHQNGFWSPCMPTYCFTSFLKISYDWKYHTWFLSHLLDWKWRGMLMPLSSEDWKHIAVPIFYTGNVDLPLSLFFQCSKDIWGFPS